MLSTHSLSAPGCSQARVMVPTLMSSTSTVISFLAIWAAGALPFAASFAALAAFFAARAAATASASGLSPPGALLDLPSSFFLASSFLPSSFFAPARSFAFLSSTGGDRSIGSARGNGTAPKLRAPPETAPTWSHQRVRCTSALRFSCAIDRSAPCVVPYAARSARDTAPRVATNDRVARCASSSTSLSSPTSFATPYSAEARASHSEIIASSSGEAPASCLATDSLARDATYLHTVARPSSFPSGPASSSIEPAAAPSATPILSPTPA
mmetsp:Transcript_6848/g.28005  ORF Transcript_6848/g.28005 Transcript_6848/m.28005 type:complete len:269 (-) Transcript_6848:131-937(-)